MFSPQMLMMAAGSQKITPEVVYQSHIIDTASTASYTFSAVAFGAADTNRRAVVVVYVSTNSASSDNRLGTVTIGGITATQVHTSLNIDTDVLEVAIYAADLPTGTTADVVVNTTGSSNVDHCSVSSYRLVSNDLAASSIGAASTAASLTDDLYVETDGAVIAGYIATTASTAASWTGNAGLTTNYNVNNSDGDAERESGVSGDTLTADTTFTVTVGSSGSANALVMACWN